MLDELLELLGKAKIYDLAQDYHTGIPHHPVHPPFVFGLTKTHGEYMRGDSSSAAEAISLGGHVGTHIDALCHFSKAGRLHGGVEVAPIQSYSAGISHGSVDTITPIVRRGVLLDVARHRDVEVVPEDLEIGPELLQGVAERQGVEIRQGDVALIRTGWARYWNDPGKYINEVKGPGPNLEAAQWLSSRGIFAGGSDTIAFEFVPSRDMPVHVHFLVEKGIHIIEALNMEELSASGKYEFVFIAAPLKITGGTGSPIRPIALA
jgi:kynurenine formamidase